MIITPGIIVIGAGAKLATAQVWTQPFIDAFTFFGHPDPSPNVVAALFANVGVESGGLTQLVESLNYGAQGLADTWKTRFAVDPKATPRVPNALALRIARKPVEIANNAYGGRMGNGSVESGDGWKYRGRGPIQITGRDNYREAAADLGMPLIEHPELLELPEAGAKSAVRFFIKNGCFPLAEAGNIAAVIQIVNGKPPCAANNGAMRIARFKAAVLRAA